jgi:hypothetical protein
MISNRNPGDRLAIRAAEWNEIARVVNASNLPNGGLVSGGELMVRCVNKGTTAIVANSLETAVVIDTLEYVSPGRDIIVVGIKNTAEVTDGATRPRINVQVSDGIAPGATGEGHVHGRISVLGSNTGSKWYLDEDMAFADDGSFVIGGSVTIGSVNYYLIERLGGAAGEPSVIVTLTGNYATFTVGKILRYTGSAWELAAIASIVSDKELIGVVTANSATETKICIWGVCTIAGLTDKSTYYLSESTPGTATLTVGSFPVFKVANGQVFIERTSPVIGDSTSGGGRLTIYTDPSKKVQVLQTGHLQATRSAVVFDYTHVNTITSITTAPTGVGVKGQMHMIY